MDIMSKQTPVQWLFNQFQRNGIYPKYSVDDEESNSKQDLIHTLIEQALEMEKKEIIEAWNKRGSTIVPKYFLEENINGEQYYNKTYKSE